VAGALRSDQWRRALQNGVLSPFAAIPRSCYWTGMIRPEREIRASYTQDTRYQAYSDQLADSALKQQTLESRQ
jgi:hypothetical protein